MATRKKVIASRFHVHECD